MTQSTENFNQLSIELTKSLSKEVKKAQGIFFTPKSIVSKLCSTALSNLEINKPTILEPSCGTCEFIKELDNLLVDVSITGIELNTDIYDSLEQLEFKNVVELINDDYINTSDNPEYDLIIGNPPYFVCKKEDVPDSYKEFISGRPNMFGVFILHSIAKLKPKGVLAFVVPKSFLNSAYYASIRNHIRTTCEICAIEDYEDNNDFLETDQTTFGLVLKKLEIPIEEVELEDCDYSVRVNGDFIFTSDAAKLKSYFENATTLKQLGFAVKTGTVVWNEKKELLSNVSSNTILLYNTNVTNDNKIKLTSFKNAQKGQYINAEGTEDPVIVVNRGNGNAKYNFKYALVDKLKQPFLVENHLNIIYPTWTMEKTELITKFNNIIQSFQNHKTLEFIEMFFGNNGLSKTELESILPIYQ